MRHLVIDHQFTRVGKVESLLLDKKKAPSSGALLHLSLTKDDLFYPLAAKTFKDTRPRPSRPGKS
jgi:hypothetical protein